MFAGAASNRAEAGSLIENFSDEFGPTTTLGGIALGSDTNFGLEATFDPTTGTVVEGGVATFAASLAINDNGTALATASLTSAAVPVPSALIVAAEAALLVGAALKAIRGQKPSQPFAPRPLF
jgi:hypothetical protein